MKCKLREELEEAVECQKIYDHIDIKDSLDTHLCPLLALLNDLRTVCENHVHPKYKEITEELQRIIHIYNK